MANWLDVFSFLATAAVCAGVVYGILYVVKQISRGVDSTKEALKTKGLHVSKEGVSVKTTGRLNREAYVDATQRGLIKAMGASTFGHSKSGSNGSAGSPNASPVLPSMHRNNSSVSTGSEEKKKTSRFQLKSKVHEDF